MTDTEMILEQLKSMQGQMDGMQGSIDNLRRDMESGFQSVNKRIDGVDQRIDSLEKRIDGLDQRMDGLEKHIDSLDQRIDGLDQRMDGLEKHIDSLDQRMDGLAQSVDDFKTEMLDEFQKQTDTLSDKSIEIDEHLSQVEHELKIYMEIAVGKRISALFDSHLVERKRASDYEAANRQLRKELEDLQVRVAVQESKTSA